MNKTKLRSTAATRAVSHLPVAGDCLKGAIISSKWDVESDKGLASLDVVQFLG